MGYTLHWKPNNITAPEWCWGVDVDTDWPSYMYAQTEAYRVYKNAVKVPARGRCETIPFEVENVYPLHGKFVAE